MNEKYKGLTSAEAALRLAANGENRLAEPKKRNPLRVFIGQFRDVMVMILLGATVISVFLGDITDALTIILIVLLNAILGFVQEFRTERTLEALRELSAPSARVYRDGKLITIPSVQVVTGDVTELQAGDKIPADGVILSCSGVSCDESMLTGESVPVAKSSGNPEDTDNSPGRSCIVYAGTIVTAGTMRARIIAVGKETQMGAISGMLADIPEEETPLQIRLGELGKKLALLCILVCIVVFLAGILRGEPIFDMLMTGISIAIAAIPEGLPAIVTISLALAVSRMLKQKALVNRLHSVETLGCADVICTDKTGTLTQNKMTLTSLFTDCGTNAVPLSGRRHNAVITELLRCGAYCSDVKVSRGANGWNTEGDPTETAIAAVSAQCGIFPDDLHRTASQPFDSALKYMAVVCGGICYVKGAGEILLKKCTHIFTENGEKPLSPRRRREFEEKLRSYAADGLRILLLARKASGRIETEGLTLIGLAAMYDPPRKEVPAAVKACRTAKIRVVMITGDHPDTAKAIARKTGIITEEVITGAELDRMSDERLLCAIKTVSVFARVTPAHKLRLVRAFRQSGMITAMTGDGVNDAPAVREADVGVAMGKSGTDVTREAADVVLLDDNFATLVKAIEQGRGVYANIRKCVRYLLSCNIGEVLTMFVGILAGLPVVLLPTQILLVNLVTDGLPAVALGLEKPEKNAMKQPPRGRNESFFAGGLMRKIVVRGILIGASTLGCFMYTLNSGAELSAARTAALVTLVFSQLFHVFECRCERGGFLRMFGNIRLLLAVVVSAAIMMLAVYFPPVSAIFSGAPLSRGMMLAALGFAAAVPFASGMLRGKI